MAETIFSRILRKEIPARILHEDEHCVAFHDINPQAPTHVLIIPRKPLTSVEQMSDEDGPLLGHLIRVARDLARKEGVAAGGYRLVINNGSAAGQTVSHLHVHLLGGRNFAWPPG